MKRFLLACSLLLVLTVVKAQDISLVPQPAWIEKGNGEMIVSPTTKIIAGNSETRKSADFLNLYLQEFYGFKLAVQPSGSSTTANAIVLLNGAKSKRVPGVYTMQVKAHNVLIEGDDAGVFYAIQTLIQLLPLEKSKKLSVPQVSVRDSARFAYRGMHLDVGRHFFPVSYIKKYIDFIAMHKMNTFHWHLTEDQGWRIEIKKYPKLTQIGAFRNGTIIGHHPGKGNDNTRYGGYYTQDEVREVVKYASQRYITVLPEIELPGHASAAIAAYPELSCFPKESTKRARNVVWAGDSTGKQVQQSWGVYPDVFCPTEYTFKFLQDVFDEVIALFPGTYIHIGGDECPKDSWKRSAFCQQMIKDKNLKDEHGLQSYFIGRIEKYLNGKGKQIIGWDEILEGGLAPNATVMSWRGEQGGIEAAKQNHSVVMTPTNYVYFDYSQTKKDDSLTIGGYLPLQRVYSYEPVPKELNSEQGKLVAGAQGNVWTEYIETPSKLEYMLFPRMSALSEVLWSPKEGRNWAAFEKRLPGLLKRYNWWKVSYSTAYTNPANN
jgi:hexosaminidase